MNALTLRPSASPDRLSADTSSVREDPRLVENVYRVVSALRADPRFAAEPLSPDAYLAAADRAANSSDEASSRLDAHNPGKAQS